LGKSVLVALIFGFFLFCGYSLYRHYSVKETLQMAWRGIMTAKNVLFIFILIGMITATWRAAGVIPYIDVVEEALCFGWIDSTLKKLPDGRLAQRLSPRRKKSHWTKLNIERCIDLEERGLMTPAGRELYQVQQNSLKF
jgi:uncharacterized protein YdeI (YjbR/CyaY-like superfamily)